MAELGPFICPSLRRLGMLVKAAYILRNRCLADSNNRKAIADSELNLRRMHNLVTRHRSICLCCRFNGALQGVAPKADNDRYYDGLLMKPTCMRRQRLS